jgi:hypothetical protein
LRICFAHFQHARISSGSNCCSTTIFKSSTWRFRWSLSWMLPAAFLVVRRKPFSKTFRHRHS